MTTVNFHITLSVSLTTCSARHGGQCRRSSLAQFSHVNVTTHGVIIAMSPTDHDQRQFATAARAAAVSGEMAAASVRPNARSTGGTQRAVTSKCRQLLWCSPIDRVQWNRRCYRADYALLTSTNRRRPQPRRRRGCGGETSDGHCARIEIPRYYTWRYYNLRLARSIHRSQFEVQKSSTEFEFHFLVILTAYQLSASYRHCGRFLQFCPRDVHDDSTEDS